MKKILIILLCCITSFAALVAHGVTVRVQPTFQGRPVQLNDVYYKLSATDSVAFSVFKCYMSSLVFYQDERVVFTEKNSFHLVNAEEPGSMAWQVSVTEPFDALVFNLGIDSVTNVSGAMGGDLDPAKGMYWTWQSGYINFKLEGRSNLCATRKNEFQLHLGGYAGSGKAVQQVRLPAGPAETVTITLPLDEFLHRVDLSKQNSVMIPGPPAVAIARIAASLLTIVP